MASFDEEDYVMQEDLLENVSNYSDSPIIEPQDIDVNLKEQTFYKVLKAIEPNVPSRPEISIIFYSFEIKNDGSHATKLGLLNLYFLFVLWQFLLYVREKLKI